MANTTTTESESALSFFGRVLSEADGQHVPDKWMLAAGEIMSAAMKDSGIELVIVLKKGSTTSFQGIKDGKPMKRDDFGPFFRRGVLG